MTTTAFVLLSLALVVAVLDWFAVAAGNRAVEYLAKPGTMVLLIAVAVSLDPSDPTARTCFVVALCLGLTGDVLLMLEDQQRFFVPGLVSFLLGHLAFVVGLVLSGTTAAGLLAGVAVVLVALATLGRHIQRGVGVRHPELSAPVSAYIGVISLMVVAAFGTRSPVAIGGALLFYTSDALIAFNRFLDAKSWMPVTIMVTYHLAQIGLVLSLV